MRILLHLISGLFTLMSILFLGVLVSLFFMPEVITPLFQPLADFFQIEVATFNWYLIGAVILIFLLFLVFISIEFKVYKPKEAKQIVEKVVVVKIKHEKNTNGRKRRRRRGYGITGLNFKG